ncbi:alpha/beta fold hydrolase [Phyllobacterium salinisoli]|uniref:Alpha/beta fold hydrolase n=1 Tax=Phyllobacterium salinisoli TaxID=1899321 RepID=A0A368JY88_9HYPH|nr:alpha/beta hydrolase [Phyllobacterium salinisoli]RCS22097.1 alpha/beta fold hydrolase [Phyllobacterium salinisoli]
MEQDSEARQVTIEAQGAQLQGLYYEPSGAPRAHLVLHGATGVPQRYYRSFAIWAAERGVGVLTYDYRDFGRSAYRAMRKSDATLVDWAVRDQAAAERTLAELAAEGSLWMIGHSLGGLGFPFRRFDARFEKITTIGAGFAHFSDHPWSYRPKALAFWFLVGPIGTALANYLPGRRLLLGEDLPAGVYWQWRKWCISRDFFKSDIGVSLSEPDFGADGPQLRMLTMADDVVVPPVAVKRFANAFPKGRVDYRMLQPADYGLSSLGHIEVFSRRNALVWLTLLER